MKPIRQQVDGFFSASFCMVILKGTEGICLLFLIRNMNSYENKNTCIDLFRVLFHR